MKHLRNAIKQHFPWLLLFFGIDGFAVLLLWISNTAAFFALAGFIVLTTALSFLAICLVLCRLEEKKEMAFRAFLDNPEEAHEKILIKTLRYAHKDAINQLGQTLRSQKNAYSQSIQRLYDYETYVESWAHETKIPLSLLTLLLDNHREELPEPICLKLDTIRSHMQEFISQMLYYARLKGTQKDYIFEPVSVCSCIVEVLEDYMPLLEEKQFQIEYPSENGTVFTDRRGLQFLLGQVVSNAVKYCCAEPELYFSFKQTATAFILHIQDNGIGVRSCDLPYIFEKGFTGGFSDGRKQATGMGLYLAKEMASDLGLTLHAKSEWGKGFALDITFPVVKG